MHAHLKTPLVNKPLAPHSHIQAHVIFLYVETIALKMKKGLEHFYVCKYLYTSMYINSSHHISEISGLN